MSELTQADSSGADHTYAEVLREFEGCVGAANVVRDEQERAYYSQDYYRKGLTALAVVIPTSVEQLATVTGLATRAGMAVFPRGGGLSYSDGYLPTTTHSIVIDTQQLQAIVEVNAEDMYVTVEAGCTWKALEDRLASTDVRPGFWGTLSGLNATIGGTIAQGGLSLGSAKYGVSSESVIALDVVTANGSIVSTGSASQAGKKPFFRHYGPDLTGLFCCDSGALGIKARVTLRLARRRKLSYGLSFGHDGFEKMVQGIAVVAREGIATEHLSFSAETMKNFGDLSFSETLKTGYQVAKTASNPLRGLMQLAKMGLAGSRFLDKAKYMSHCVVEAGNKKELNGQIALLHEAVAPYGFTLPNTVPTVIRANPFGPTDVLSPDGQRLLPIHTILPMSNVVDFHRQLQTLLSEHATAMSEHGITQQPILGTIGTNGFLYEPVFYWRDQPQPYHLRNANPDIVAQAQKNPDNPAAREVLEKIRAGVVELMHQCGGVHLQVGKMYPYMQDRAEPANDLLKSLKRELDPQGLMNPGALGL